MDHEIVLGRVQLLVSRLCHDVVGPIGVELASPPQFHLIASFLTRTITVARVGAVVMAISLPTA